LEDGWLLLSWFQDGVGQTPIDAREKGAKNISPRQLGVPLREKNDWLEAVLAEQEALIRALDRFKEAHAKST
jgi:hypothetical protein